MWCGIDIVEHIKGFHLITYIRVHTLTGQKRHKRSFVMFCLKRVDEVTKNELVSLLVHGNKIRLSDIRLIENWHSQGVRL